MTLSDLKPNECAVIKSLETKGSMRRRFMDIGLIRGTLVRCLGKSTFNDPHSYLIRGAVIAIRNSDAETVTIERKEISNG